MSDRTIVALLCSDYISVSHCVLIYDCDAESYKIKDSHGKNYKIPKSRPTTYQAHLTKITSRKVGFEQFENAVNRKIRNEINFAKVQYKQISFEFYILYDYNGKTSERF